MAETLTDAEIIAALTWEAFLDDDCYFSPKKRRLFDELRDINQKGPAEASPSQGGGIVVTAMVRREQPGIARNLLG